MVSGQSYMGVIVTTNADKSGDTISGRHVKIVVVKTDPGTENSRSASIAAYLSRTRSAECEMKPRPRHDGTGKIVATFCG